MDQLTTSDAMFLYMENATNYGHVGGLGVLDAPKVPTYEVREGQVLEDHTEAFLQMIPFSRRRLLELPLKLGHPVWINDPDFDPEYHIRQIAVPAPGSPQQVEQILSRIASRPLDRSRPLWEMYEIEGLDGGKHAGVYTKIHHAAADGTAMMAMALATLSMTPDIVHHPRPATEFQPDRIPTDLELMAKGLTNVVARPGRSLSWTRRMFREMAEMVGGDSEIRSRLPEIIGQVRDLRAPKTRFSAMVGPHRRWAYGSTSLEELKQIRKHFGVTINDVVLAICAGALRNWFQTHDELPDEPLIAMVPVNIREGDGMAGGNQISAIPATLHTHIADPEERLGKIAESMGTQKAMQKAVSATTQMEAMELMPAWAMYNALRLAYRTRQTPRFSPFNLTISNVPGPQFPVYMDGAKQLHSYAYSTITDGMGLNITVSSYDGNLDWGVVADRDMVDDLWPMWACIQDAQAELLKLSA
jgi:diacylglycerol O-acyltransferase